MVSQGQWRSKRRGLERLAGVRMVVEVMGYIVVVGGVRPLFELLRGSGGVVIIFFVEIGERFAEIFDLEVWSDRPKFEGMALD
jgi:hypothetical protein